eukprot:augustus_masked-scaffold_11-processed-gene-1.8-mRNA-1 protein AED:1.00 eAED:1.00 QI:0/-1/0/0/-1/1/1/0/571
MSYTQNPFGAQPGGSNPQPQNNQPSGPYGGNPNAAFGNPSQAFFTQMNFEAPVVNGRVASKLIKPDATGDESSSEESETDSDSDDSEEEPLPSVKTNGVKSPAEQNFMNNSGAQPIMQPTMQSASFQPQQQQQQQPQQKKKGLFSKLPFFKKKEKGTNTGFEQPQMGQMNDINNKNSAAYVPGSLNDVYGTPEGLDILPQQEPKQSMDSSVLSSEAEESEKVEFKNQPQGTAMVSNMSVTPFSPKMTPGTKKTFDLPPGLGLATKKNIAQQQPLQPAGMGLELQDKFEQFNLTDQQPTKKPDLPPRVGKKDSVNLGSKPRKNSKYNTNQVADLLKPSTESVNLGVNALFSSKGSSQSLKLAAKEKTGGFDTKLREKAAKVESVKLKMETIQAKSQTPAAKKQSLTIDSMLGASPVAKVDGPANAEKKDRKKKKKKKKKRKKEGDKRKRKREKDPEGKKMSYKRKGSSSMRQDRSGTRPQRKGSSSSRKKSYRPSGADSFNIPSYKTKPQKSTNAQSLEKVDAMIKGMESSLASPDTDAAKKEQLRNMVQKLKQKRTNLQLSAGLELLEELE